MTFYVARTAEIQDQLHFQVAVHQTEDDIRIRLESYIAILRAGSALFAANDVVTQGQFRAFVDRLELQDDYPGIQGIGFSVRVPPEQSTSFEARMQEAGLDNFRIWPNTPATENHTIIYLEPLDRRNQTAIGYNMFSEAVRREAMIRARDNGTEALSGKVLLVQEIDSQKQPGFLIYMPVYQGGDVPDTRAQRRDRLLGFVYSPFRAEDLFRGIFGDQTHTQIDFQLFDGPTPSDANLLYTSNKSAEADSVSPTKQRQTFRTIQIAGRPWSLIFTARPAIDNGSSRGLVPLILIGGLGISLILFGISQAQAKASTAAQRSAQELSQSEERFRIAAESASDLIYEVDLQAGLVEWFGPIDEHLGYDLNEFPRTTDAWSAHIHPDDYPRVMASIQQHLETGAPYYEEYRVRQKDGTLLHWTDRATAVRDQAGKPIKWVGVTTNITGQKRAEAALMLLAEAGTTLTASLDQGTILQNVAALLVPKFADVCLIWPVMEEDPVQGMTMRAGTREQVLVGQVLQEQYSQDHDIRHNAMARVLQLGHPELYREVGEHLAQIVPKPGELLAWDPKFAASSCLVVPLPAHAQIQGVIYLVRMGSQRRYEYGDLGLVEEVVRRMALAMDNARLYREAQEAIQVRDQFLSIASHELKTPITSIKGYAELLQRRTERNGSGDSRHQRAIQVIQSESLRLTKLIELLLDASRIQAGRLQLEQAPLDVCALLDRLVMLIQPTIETHTLLLSCPTQRLIVIGDELRLEQVFQNLISNAIKYSPQGGIVLLEVTSEETQVCISITDQGIGIPAEALPQLFSRFYRVDHPESRGISGMGLGLYIVHYLVEAHGGTVSVVSQPDQGSTFTVVLPLHRAPGAEGQTA